MGEIQYQRGSSETTGQLYKKHSLTKTIRKQGRKASPENMTAPPKAKLKSVSDQELKETTQLNSLHLCLAQCAQARVAYEPSKSQMCLRVQLLDWAEQYFRHYHLHETTYFLMTSLYDQYMLLHPQVHSPHLLMTVSLWVAVKFNEVKQFSLSFVHQQIAQQQYSLEQIKEQEVDLMGCVGFQLLGSPSIYQVAIHLLKSAANSLTQKQLQVMDSIILIVTKSLVFNQQITSSLSHKEVAAATLYISLKKLQIIFKQLQIGNILNRLLTLVGLTADQLLGISQQILDYLNTFESLQEQDCFTNLRAYITRQHTTIQTLIS